MSKKRIWIVLVVIAVIISVLIGIIVVVKKISQQKYEQQQMEYRESLDNYVPNIDMEAYLKEKERWDIAPSAPVHEYGMMNVYMY